MQQYDWIYLSPHLDDAALSCGGQIAQASQRGESILIVTITAGDPVAPVSDYAATLHARWELVNATEARRQEDLAACAILGADALHWSVPDCIYRVDEDGTPFYVSDDDIFGAVAPAEMGLVHELAAQMCSLPPAHYLIIPLAVGQHVDHQLTRLAAEQAFPQHTLRYYEDYPYAQQPGKLAKAFSESRDMWVAETIRLDESALAVKYDAVAAFRSQLSTFFQDRADLEMQIGGYAARVARQFVPNQSATETDHSVGAERRWRSLPVIE